MRLSFVLPCYNVERYIGACLDSLFRQDISEEDYEVICVNDCSTDNTRDIIVSYQKKHRNIILLDHKTNLTAGGARNTGLDIATGTYIWFVDPDDMLVDNVLRTLIDKADNNNLDILLFNYKVINETDGVVKMGEELYQDSSILDGYSFLDFYFNKNIGKNSIVWRQLYRRTLIENSVLRYPQLRVSQDAIFSWKALFAAKRVQSKCAYCYIYRKNLYSTTGSKLTAEKVFANSVLAQYELHLWTKTADIRLDYINEIHKAIRYDLGRLFVDYNQLALIDKVKLYRLLSNKKTMLKTLSVYGGTRMNIAIKSIYCGIIGFSVTCKLLF